MGILLQWLKLKQWLRQIGRKISDSLICVLPTRCRENIFLILKFPFKDHWFLIAKPSDSVFILFCHVGCSCLLKSLWSLLHAFFPNFPVSSFLLSFTVFSICPVQVTSKILFLAIFSSCWLTLSTTTIFSLTHTLMTSSFIIHKHKVFLSFRS